MQHGKNRAVWLLGSMSLRAFMSRASVLTYSYDLWSQPPQVVRTIGKMRTTVSSLSSGVWRDIFFLYAFCTMALGFAIFLAHEVADVSGCTFETSIRSSPPLLVARMYGLECWPSCKIVSMTG